LDHDVENARRGVGDLIERNRRRIYAKHAELLTERPGEC
jgi:hypothetical protein